MDDPQRALKEWLAEKVAPHGEAKKLADATGLSSDKITRSKELAASDPKKRRQLQYGEIRAISMFYRELPPGYEGMTQWLRDADAAASNPKHASIIGSFDPDAPEEMHADNDDEAPPPPPGSGDVANLAISGGLGIGSPEGVEVFDSGQIYADHVNGYWSFPPAVKAGWRNMPQVYSMPVTGDSMEPTLASGSYVFVDMTHTVPQPEDIYACDFGDGLSIKRLQLVPRSDKIKVMSDNERYEDYVLRRDEVRVYGRVVAWFQWRG